MESKKRFVFLTFMFILVGFFGVVSATITDVTVTNPLSGDYLNGVETITWDLTGTDNANDRYNVDYSSDGLVWQTLTNPSLSPGSTSYDWDTDSLNGDFQIRVQHFNSGLQNEDIVTDLIVDNTDPAIDTNTLTAPDGIEVIAGGSTFEITWNDTSITDTNLDSSPITLEYSTDSGSTWNSIATGEANDGRYSWNVPEINSLDVLVKITATDLAGNSASDVSDNVFTIDSIKPSIDDYQLDNSTISPNGDGIEDAVEIDLNFSEKSDYDIEILSSENSIVKSWSGRAQNPNPKNWNGTYTNGTVVPDGVYKVNVSLTDYAGNLFYNDSVEITVESGVIQVGGSSNYQTIQAGIDTASNGDVINVGAGSYVESVDVNKEVTIIGVGETTIINPTIDQNGFIVTADNVVIKDLKITTSNSGVTPNIAIAIEDTDNVEINNVVIETTGNKAMGIWVGGSSNGINPSSNLKIVKTQITINDEATGIYAAHSNPAHSGWIIGGRLADANTITAYSNPVELYDVSDSEVSYNALTISGGGVGSNVIWSSELSDISNLVFNYNIVDSSGGSQVAFLTDFIDSLDPGDILPDTAVSTVTVLGNTFTNWGSRALRIGVGVTNVLVNENQFLVDTQTETLWNEDASQVNAQDNWWNATDNATIFGLVSGNIDYTPWAYAKGQFDNQAPTIVLSDTSVDEGSSVLLDASGSTDNAAGIANYEWDLNNDSFYELSGANMDNATFDASSINGATARNINIRITDNSGNVATKTITITVNNVAPTVINATSNISSATIYEIIRFNATATDPIDSLAYSWNFGDGNVTSGQNLTHSYNQSGTYTVNLTVSDGEDVSSTMLQINVNDLIWDLTSPVSGWNLVSVPKELSDNSVPENTMMWYYDGTDWLNPTTIEPGVGYWVDNSSEKSLGFDYAGDCNDFPRCLPSGKINIDALQNSWNLIGLTTTDTMNVSSAFSSTIFPDTNLPVYYVVNYNESTDEFEFMEAESNMTAGTGYWVYVVK